MEVTLVRDKKTKKDKIVLIRIFDKEYWIVDDDLEVVKDGKSTDEQFLDTVQSDIHY